MEKETLEKFYLERMDQREDSLTSDRLLFNILPFDACTANDVIPYRKRDFFKFAFLKGNHIVHFANKSIDFSGSTLAFFNPDIPYTVDMPGNNSTGFYFIFRESYLNDYFRHNIKTLPIFAPDYRPLYVLDEEQEKRVEEIFMEIKTEFESDYYYKHDLIRKCITELIHLAIKIKPVEKIYQDIDANVRITGIFNELLDRQFPIDNPTEFLRLRSAKDYASSIRIHINHLNRALKTTTGKTTTELIMERILEESKILLKHSNWTISEISYALGFKNQANFNHFFKKAMQLTPSVHRG